MSQQLIIDGHNLIHAWPELSRLLKGGKAGETAARSKLTDDLRVLHDYSHYRVTIVFDGKGDTTERDAVQSDTSFQVLYSALNLTADTVIERLVSTNDCPGEITVASGDRLVRETTLAAGGKIISARELKEIVATAEARQSRELRGRQAQSDSQWGTFLWPE